MKLNTITIAVTDMERTIAFYRAMAQLKVIRRFNPGQGEIAFMADREGDTAPEFVQRPELEPVRATGLTLRFQTRGALEPLREQAFAMGYAPSPIQSQPPKPVHFTVTDPNGLRVEFSK